MNPFTFACQRNRWPRTFSHCHTDLTQPDANPSAGHPHPAARGVALHLLQPTSGAANRTDRGEVEDLGNKLRLPLPAPAAARRVGAGDRDRKSDQPR
jgi:hypothetical protein